MELLRLRTPSPGVLRDALVNHIEPPVKFVFIGTDRSIGDSIGPMIGTFLEELGVPNVYGTLDEPLHADSMPLRLPKILSPDYNIVAIDAALGDFHTVGNVVLRDEPLTPGSALGKTIPAVGDFHISIVVNVMSSLPGIMLNNTRLSVIWKLATYVSDEISSYNVCKGLWSPSIVT